MLLLITSVYLSSRQDTAMSNLSTPSHSLLLFVEILLIQELPDLLTSMCVVKMRFHKDNALMGIACLSQKRKSSIKVHRLLLSRSGEWVSTEPH